MRRMQGAVYLGALGCMLQLGRGMSLRLLLNRPWLICSAFKQLALLACVSQLLDILN